MTILATACAGESTPAAVDAPEPIAALAPPSGPVVEVVPRRSTPPLDPNAAPTTPLGELRARYLPIWSPDFDWAFPPEECGSDWPLDAIAEPTAGADLAILGDAAAAAALSVMRYEHLVSRALAEPTALGQLCVAVGAVGSARSDALDLLATHLSVSVRTAGSAGFPDEVTIVAAGPTMALAVACVMPGYVGVITTEEEPVGETPAPARLGAYLLTVSRGLEDAVVDVSYRVSEITYLPAEACAELDTWAGAWHRKAEEWADSGEIWGAVDRTVTVEGLCDSPPRDGPEECPREWSS